MAPSSLPSTLILTLVEVLLLSDSMLSARDSHIVYEGDVYIDIILSLYDNDDGTCGTIDPKSVQELEAVRWAIHNLNVPPYVPGVTLGLRAHPTCRSMGKVALVAANLANELSQNKSKTFGIIGPDYSSEAKVISSLLGSLTEEYRLPMIGYATTAASLSDGTLYKNFFRVIPPDNIQISAMEHLLVAMNWTYFAVIYDDDAYGHEGVRHLESVSKQRGICLIEKIAIDTQLSYQETTSKLNETFISLVNQPSPVLGVVVFGGTQLSASLLDVMNKSLNNVQKFPILILSEAAMDVGMFAVNWPTVLAGSFALNPPRRQIEKFEIYWESLYKNQTKLREEAVKNPWLLDVFELVSNPNCRPSNITCGQLPQNILDSILVPTPFVHFAIQATIVLIEAIKNVYNYKCNNADLCSSFLNVSRTEITNKLAFSKVELDAFPLNIKSFQGISVIFNGSVDAEPQQQSNSYVVFNCQENIDRIRDDCFKEVGNYNRLSNKLEISKDAIKDYKNYPNYTELSWNDIRKGQCSNGSLCSRCVNNEISPVLIIPGELYIVGVVPVHSRGALPMQCGDLKRGGMDIAEAINFAIHQSRFQYGVDVPNATIGAIIMDSCTHPLLIKERLLTLYRYGIINKDGSYLQIISKVLGFVAAWTSDVSISVADILTEIKHVQISYGSTASILSNRTMFPYFLRMTSSDTVQAKVMLDIIKDLGANYIQIINSDNSYGNGGKDVILESLDEYGICVAQVITIPSFPKWIQSDIIQKIRQFTTAKVVILFLSTSDFEWLVPSLEERLFPREFIFIASEEWGRRPLLQKVNNLLGTLTLSADPPMNQKFREQMLSLRSNGQDDNPWLESFLEHELKCHLQWSFNKSSSKPCRNDAGLKNDYQVDLWVPFVENAVYALLTGASRTLTKQCGKTEDICDKYRGNITELIEQIKRVKLDLYNNGNSEYIFDSNGDGKLGYSIYMVDNEAGGVKYSKIGTSSPFSWKKDEWMTLMNLKGQSPLKCEDRASCPNCFQIDKPGSSLCACSGYLYSTISLIIVCTVSMATVIFLLIKLRRKGGNKLKLFRRFQSHVKYIEV
ncbi:hypothetical protein CHS0354_018815 [Potamilus streckersoni]|uniref:Receptor ligand binding region domain-containing protein n=1 Tax=Potamilus streckersoni TaxID=2493646 RepID=A0AAE0TJ57_9BIVA|nr:hypothetical protein CHS0354_018815 [Potamilus streckersoni]